MEKRNIPIQNGSRGGSWYSGGGTALAAFSLLVAAVFIRATLRAKEGGTETDSIASGNFDFQQSTKTQPCPLMFFVAINVVFMAVFFFFRENHSGTTIDVSSARSHATIPAALPAADAPRPLLVIYGDIESYWLVFLVSFLYPSN
jgi:hypothetical protein